MAYCILDWPEHSHTSPSSTLLTVTVFLPFRVSVNGPPAGRGARLTRQCPSVPATVETDCVPSVTVTFSDGSAVPQTGTWTPRCKTMLSWNSADGRTSARDAAGARSDNAVPIHKQDDAFINFLSEMIN